MDRNNTNFQSELYDLLKKALDTGELSDKLFYYQKLAVYYATFGKTGLYIWHDMGLGKTITAVAICAMLHQLGYTVIVVTPKSLQPNFKKGIKEYNNIMADVKDFQTIDSSMFNFTVKSSAINRNISKIVGQTQVFEEDRTAVRIHKLQKKTVFIIDEAHQVSQLISNGSDEWREFYEMILRSPLAKIIMLSGSLFNSNPFELVPICNLLSGQELFPAREDEFMNLFWNRRERKMINRGTFQNRIYGLFSRMELSYLEAKTTNFYPEQRETQVVRCKMKKYQFESYMLARSKELQEKRASVKSVRPVIKKFESADRDSSTYRVESRKYSNFVPPPGVIEEQPKTIGEAKKILSEIPAEYFHATKIEELHKIVKRHKGQKGLIYSQFVGLGGAAPIAESFNRVGYEEYGVKNTSPNRYAFVNGSVSMDEQNRILETFDDPKNDHAEIIQFLIIGIQQTNGLDCKCVRFIVMLEPYWVWSLWDQLVKRGVRFMSHTRLPAEERNVTPYILQSVYPDDIDEKILTTRGLETTTDEQLYGAMIKNKAKTEAFKEPIIEVAIECLFVKEQNPKHICRVCAPNNKKLFTEGVDALQGVKYDANRSDPCNTAAKEEVKAIKIEYGDIAYYAVPDPDSKYGYAIYYKIGNEYEEILPTSPIFKELIKILQQSKTT